MAHAVCSFEAGCPRAVKTPGSTLCPIHERPLPACANWMRDLFLSSDGRVYVDDMDRYRRSFKPLYPMEETRRTLRRLAQEGYLHLEADILGDVYVWDLMVAMAVDRWVVCISCGGERPDHSTGSVCPHCGHVEPPNDDRSCASCGADVVGNDPHADSCPIDPINIEVGLLEEVLVELSNRLNARGRGEMPTNLKVEAKRRRNIAEQRRWIAEHGSNLTGYILRYGSKNDPDHSGDGGEAIYAADAAELARLEGNGA